MALREIESGIWIGNVGDAGDASALTAAGVGLVLLCHTGRGAPPHTAGVIYILATVHDEGTAPAWAAKGMAGFVAAARAQGVAVALCDGAGGEREGAYVLTALKAEAGATDWETAEAEVLELLPAARIPDGLRSQGGRVWPKG